MNETIVTKMKFETVSILKQLDDIACNPTTEGLRERYEEVKEDILQHAAGEVNSVFLKLRDRAAPALAAELLELTRLKHHDMKESLQRMNLLETGSVEWWNEFYSFKKKIRQQYLELEAKLINEVQKDFNHQELKSMVADYVKARDPGPEVTFF